MQVERARELGLCFGVRRAVAMLREAVTSSGIETLGPVAHNRILMRELEELGIESIPSLEQLKGPAVVISAHGVPPETARILEERGFGIVDTTCPIVAKAQSLAAGLARDGFTIVIFGDSAHVEVKGLLGWAGAEAVASTDGAALVASGRLESASKIAVLAQTTQPAGDFSRFAASLCGTLADGTRELRIMNTLCDATRRRQEAAAELARRVDVMLIIGGKDSANTRRLAEACALITETHHVESADELEPDWFEGKQTVGVTAGASTPDSSVEEVERAVRAL
jgi:(E)-4-hydroxy-3-methyl-but-2-enyl pyrophosphate reductase